MEAFSLLKYWRAAGGGAPASASSDGREVPGTTTVVAAVEPVSDEEGNDDGPFFDLEFAVPDDEEEEGQGSDDNASTWAENGGDAESDGGGTDGDGEGEFDFTLSSASSNDRSDQNLSLSPSDDLFFKGRLIPVEPSTLALSNGSEHNSSKPPQFPVSLIKSATKFRVMMLGFKKSKQTGPEKTAPTLPASPKKEKPPPTTAAESREKKFFTVKFKVEEVPIMSLFTRDNRVARNSSAKKATAPPKQTAAAAGSSDEIAVSDEKLFPKDVMQKYLKKVKPLYVRVSRRYGDKLRFSGQLNLGSAAKPVQSPPSSEKPVPAVSEKNAQPPTEATEVTAPGNTKTMKQVNIPAGLRVVCKHLGKSRSASSAVAAPPPQPALSKRRDDSLLQQQDGIQSAILHCKRSFNCSRDSDSSSLSHSVPDSAKEKPKPKQSDGDDGSKKPVKEKEKDDVA